MRVAIGSDHAGFQLNPVAVSPGLKQLVSRMTAAATPSRR